MKPLDIFCRNRVMYAQITVHDKSTGMKDYHLYNKNGLAFYVFRKSQGVWQLANYHLEDNGLLTEDQVQKYIAMIQRGELKWIKDDIR